jgi:aldehyde:ferredoxin oxidoreductase
MKRIQDKKSSDFNRMIGFNNNVYKGRYFHSGTGFMSDALTHVLPLLASYSTKKLKHFAGNVVDELDDHQGMRKSLKRASKKTARSVLRDLSGGSTRSAKKVKRKRKQKSVKKVKSDFFDNV